MAIYHLSAKVIQRSKGRSSVAAAAYRSGENLTNQRDGRTHSYANRKGHGIDHTEILTPEHAPEWMRERESLWNGVEDSEKRKDAQTAREIEVALPRELPLEKQKELLRGFVQEQFVQKGMVADMAIHDSGAHNPHAHILLTTRNIEENGFGKKNRDWNSKKNLNESRQSWEDHLNNALEDSGHTSRVDHRTLEEQGIDRAPDVHRGVAASAMQKKGKPTPRLEKRQKRRDTDNAFRKAFNRPQETGSFKADHRKVQKALQKHRDKQKQGKELEHGNSREKDTRDVQNNLNKHRRYKPPKRKLGEWEKYLTEQQKQELQREDR